MAMTSRWNELIDRFADLRVLVIGDAMLDRYYRGKTNRLCQEAPVPIVAVDSIVESAGGAANVAVNIAGLGATPYLVGVVGDDLEGEAVSRCLADVGCTTTGLMVEPGRRTLSKQRVIAGSQLLLRLDQGDTRDAGIAAQSKLIGSVETLLPQCDAVVISDYGYGVLTDAVIEGLQDILCSSPKPVFVDAKDWQRYSRIRPTMVKPNYFEAVGLLRCEELTGTSSRLRQVEAFSENLLDETGAEIAAVTLDIDGCALLTRKSPPHLACTQPRASAHGAGAGDTFLAAFALTYVVSENGPIAADLATMVAGIAVGRNETALCSVADLRARLTETPAGLDRDGLIDWIARERARGRRIVFTNGCFDIIHSGHTSFLREARSLGDVLIVGLNSDESVTRLKGPGRPINSLTERASVLASLGSVDYVAPFDEDTPEALIEIVRPEIFVKGGDYRREELPEAPLVEALGGTVRILRYVEEHSTTGIINRISSRVAMG